MTNQISLREQVYHFFWQEMQNGVLAPGTAINLNEISKKLGISKTPLRDALIQLETEGFVTILPRRGIIVNSLPLHDIKSYYEILGALESSALLSIFDKIKNRHIEQMEDLLDVSVAECERFYPAFQFVVWGGKTPAEAVESAILDTVGEA